MKREEVQERLNRLFQRVFDDDTIEIHAGMTAHDIPGWDSMMHVTLMVAVEDEFGVTFGSGEARRLQNVGGMIEAVCAKQG